MKKFFAIVAILLVFSAQNAVAREQTTKVKCEKPANEYLKDAENSYKASFNTYFVEYRNMYVDRSTAAALLYQICSELEKNTSPHSDYSAPSDHAIPSPSATQKSGPQLYPACSIVGSFFTCTGL